MPQAKRPNPLDEKGIKEEWQGGNKQRIASCCGGEFKVHEVMQGTGRPATRTIEASQLMENARRKVDFGRGIEVQKDASGQDGCRDKRNAEPSSPRPGAGVIAIGHAYVADAHHWETFTAM
jgi:hypothetical protein